MNQISDPGLLKGLAIAERIAIHFGWVVRGFGYPHEGVSFSEKGKESFKLDSVAIEAILTYIGK